MNRDDQDIPDDLRSLVERIKSDGDTSSDLADVWALLERAAPSASEVPKAQDTWEGVRRHLNQDRADTDRRAEERGPIPSASSPERRWRWVGGMALVMVLLFTGWWWSRPLSVETETGTTVAHTLPDGSMVDLNADSRVSYSRAFSTWSFLESDQRRVQVRGEAYFDVTSGARPFLVRTPSADIEVMGTAFSVRSRAEDNHETHVALSEGSVQVTSRGAERTEVTLEPGQAVTIEPTGSRTAVRDTSLDRVTVWRRGGFAVTDASLRGVARSLERRFGEPIRLAPSIPRSIRAAPLTLYYSQSVGLERILHDVCMARNLTYRATANGYVLARAGDTQASRSP